ncbi:cleavage and polyadenylation specificity factor subunit 1 [Eurytemora carolleeae]|uniref:cleavage and polyadenylation specificity factor subunit 1 n=1 Tax=Eurytemora carolleeae TaxID=1294199 RepID=UPI000C75CE50|nr:cleavage and polyadenylation specificity factor subunit 1 [Eurytemora carolleeae]|eukprot:XP_023327813.1 cleavage and polyadenylation specificity factor subunit 1-like [Eurytemora affinis]
MPTGGTLVFAVNSLFYLNQGIPCYGVSLNATGDKGITTDIHIRPLEGVKLSLDCAVAEFLSTDQLVISLKGGELYVLTLLVDAMRAVKGFHLDKAAASVLTTCLSLTGKGYLFLGSRLGNSLLLKYTSRDAGQIGGRREKEPPNKKKRLDTTGDWLDAENEELEVYGSTPETVHHKISAFTFEVCDSLLNIGPCGYVSMGEPAFLSEEFSTNSPDPDIELVTTAGIGKNGALCVLQRSIRPQVVTTFELPGCVDMWTVFGPNAAQGGAAEHSYLILSRKDSSMVLQTGQEINELDTSGFRTTEPTVFAGNIGGNGYILQVVPNAVLLLKDCDLVQTLDIDLGGPIRSVSCADPHLSLVSESGQAAVLTLKEGTLSIVKTKIGELPGRMKSPLVAVSLYRDKSGLLTTETKLSNKEKQTRNTENKKQPKDLDEEDELLYGSGEAQVGMFSEGGIDDNDENQDNDEGWRKHLEPVKITYWCVGVRQNGNFELYSVPDFTLRFVSLNFPHTPNVLVDNMSTRASTQSDATRGLENLPEVTEIRLVGLGIRGRRPLLLARLRDQEVVIYELYEYQSPSLSPDQLKIRFRKLSHGLVLRDRKSRKGREEKQLMHRHSLRYFRDIAGYEGVFISGPYPHWLFLTSRGELRLHPMSIDGSISTFAPFHNVNCPQGFLYFNRISELRICVLPGHLSYDAPWPVRKVPLRCSPHQVAFHIESKTFAVITSVAEPSNKVWKFNGDDKELNIEDRSDRFLYPLLEKFSLQLFSPVSWESIPGTKLQLEDWEYVTCMKHLYLSSEGMHSGQRGFLVLGTNFNYGEDITSRGHIKIYDVIEVVPEPGQPLTKHKIKTVYDKEQKGPVTAISAVSGFLVSTVGQKIYIWQFKDKELHGIAFIDSNVYIHQIHALKNFLLVGDVYKSINVLQYQQDYRTVSVISRDTSPLEVYAAEFIIDNGHLGFLATDSERNLSMFVYSPESKESLGGLRLIRKADIHLGQHVNCMWRVRAKLTDPSTSQRVLAMNEKKHVTWYATLDGALGYILPISEKVYRRLLMLNNVLSTNLPQTAGLNPKAFRTIRTNKKDLRNPCRGIVDGDLVFRFSDLPASEKAEFARKIGTTSAEIMDDLAELDRNAAHY